MSECIRAPGAYNNMGYGLKSRDGVRRLAHRLAYCDHHGIPVDDIDGKVVRHKCDNPCCINPDHLELGSNKDNTNDMRVRGRMATGFGLPQTKLSDSQRKEIYLRRAAGERNKDLAAEYGVCCAVITANSGRHYESRFNAAKRNEAQGELQ